MKKLKYTKCERAEIPENVRWDVPPQNQGQIIEVAYATPKPFATLAERGDKYKRIIDRSEPPGSPGRETYYRLT